MPTYVLYGVKYIDLVPLAMLPKLTGIRLSPPGSFFFEVRLANQKTVHVRAEKPTEVEPVREKIAIGALFQEFESLLEF